MLYVEGKADEILVWKLGVARRQTKRGKDKGGVLRLLVRERNCQGLVDDDPASTPPRLLDLMAEVTTHDLGSLGLRLYRHGERGNTLIVLCPKLEDWIVASARNAGLSLEGYGLPSSPNRLHDVINDELRKLNRLLDDLLSANSSRILRLQSLLTQ